MNARDDLLDDLEHTERMLRRLDESILADYVRAAAEALRALTAPAGVPDGFVLVPREPTEAMKESGGEAIAESDPSQTFYADEAASAYRAMLAAAPPSDAPGEAIQSQRDAGSHQLDGGVTAHRGDDGLGNDAADSTGGFASTAAVATPGIPHLSPSPAEQGAREIGEQELKRDIVAVMVGLDRCDHPLFLARADALIRVLGPRIANLAPLAAGRVGVVEPSVRESFEKWVSKRHGYALDRWHDTEEYHSRSTHEFWECWQQAAALAGPLVAGEVEAVLWLAESDRLNLLKDGHCTVFRERPTWADDEEIAPRPLVYADTAKGETK